MTASDPCLDWQFDGRRAQERFVGVEHVRSSTDLLVVRRA
jgi:hypothetical protein